MADVRENFNAIKKTSDSNELVIDAKGAGNAYFAFMAGVESEQYALEEIRFKFPSEHIMTDDMISKRAPVEMQLIHTITKYVNKIDEKKYPFHKKNKKAIISIFFDTNGPDHQDWEGDPFLKQIGIDPEVYYNDWGATKRLKPGETFIPDRVFKGNYVNQLNKLAVEYLNTVINVDHHLYR